MYLLYLFKKIILHIYFDGRVGLDYNIYQLMGVHMNSVSGAYRADPSFFSSQILPGTESTKVLWEKLNAARVDSEIPLVKGLRSRFPGIGCEPETMVQTEAGARLHANFMGKGVSDRRLIASQYPYADVLAGGGETFWSAVYEQSAAIVDLTGPRDLMQPYYPSEEQKEFVYPALQVAWISTQDKLSVYRVTPQGKEPRYIARMHYDTWPDYGVIPLEELQELIRRVTFMVPNPNDPIWVHCRAGIGRTGTLVTALILKDQNNRKELKRENLGEQLISIILQLRSQRNFYFVQTQEQFKLLFDYALSLLD